VSWTEASRLGKILSVLEYPSYFQYFLNSVLAPGQIEGPASHRMTARLEKVKIKKRPFMTVSRIEKADPMVVKVEIIVKRAVLRIATDMQSPSVYSSPIIVLTATLDWRALLMVVDGFTVNIL